MHRWLALILLVVGCENRPGGSNVEQGDEDEPPRWHFERVEHSVGDMTLTDIFGRDDGTIVVVGWYGTIFTNRKTEQNPQGLWRPMISGTTEHLTGIYGVSNGRQFNQQNARDGEMFAVGWNGTLLHYHPNPNDLPQPQPEDGRWQLIGGPGHGFTARVKIDPFCPDYDGDGMLDDNGGNPADDGPDGWWSPSDACVGGAVTDCDDNCRTSPNGPDRPIVDLDGDFGGGVCASLPQAQCTSPCAWDGALGRCAHPAPRNCLEASDDGGVTMGPPVPPSVQADEDNDGVGTVCDDALGEPAVSDFRPTLFDVWATVHPSDNTQVVVVAVGENGALLSYVGANAAQTVTLPALPITERDAWIAQEQIPFWYSNDCPFLGVAPDPDGTCPGSGRLSPRCPAQCSVLKSGSAYGNANDCECLVDQAQCCTPGYNGAACDPGSAAGCTSELGDNRAGMTADDGCAASGQCYDGCPNCFRRLDKTLRAITSDGNTLFAVGAAGTVIYLNGITDPTGVWVHRHCGANTPAPLDEQPVLTGVSTVGGSFETVGAGGAVLVINPTGACEQYPRCGAPPAFMSGIFSRGNGQAWAVGDAGTFVDLQSASTDCLANPAVVEIETDIDENLYSIWVFSRERMWFAGASGTLIRAGYYAGGALEPLP